MNALFDGEDFDFARNETRQRRQTRLHRRIRKKFLLILKRHGELPRHGIRKRIRVPHRENVLNDVVRKLLSGFGVLREVFGDGTAQSFDFGTVRLGGIQAQSAAKEFPLFVRRQRFNFYAAVSLNQNLHRPVREPQNLHHRSDRTDVVHVVLLRVVALRILLRHENDALVAL